MMEPREAQQDVLDVTLKDAGGCKQKGASREEPFVFLTST